MKVLAAYTAYQWKRYFRAPVTLGWTFAFPVTLLLIFGGARMRPLVEYTTAANVLSPDAYAEFLTMGLIGLNTASIGIFGLGIVLVQARSLGILRRLALTPQPAWKFVMGQILASSAIVAVSSLLLLTVGACFFHVSFPRRPAEWCVVLGFGSIAFLAIGYALAASMHEVRTAQIVGNTVFLLLMFLGGVWFPLASLPPVVQRIGFALPLSHFLEALRSVGALGQPLRDHLVSLAILAAWSAVAAVVAGWQFRWHEAQR
jgi:ABC-2 type transport system permease protein